MGVIDRIESLENRLPDSREFFEWWLSSPARQFLLFLAVAFLLRMATFGDPAVSVDEDFYFLVGQRIHIGDIPYVDVWDRKPLGLFLLYYLFAGISHSVLAYQIAATLFVAVTGLVIARTVMRWTGAQGAVLAGIVYLILLNPFQGDGGQTPVFYNLLVAASAYLVLGQITALERGHFSRAVWLAMALLGIALTFKQTTFFEAAYFGSVVCWLAVRGQCLKLWHRIPAMIFLGILPTCLIATWYWHAGYWAEYWQAMVLSNLQKQNEAGQYVLRIFGQLARAWPLIVMIALAIGSSLAAGEGRRFRPFLLGWLIAAIFGYIVVPNVYLHYALPLLVPMSVISASELNRKTIGPYWLAVIFAGALAFSATFDFAVHAQNRAAMSRLASAISKHDPRRTLLLYEAPPLLLPMSGSEPMTPLMFPLHFSELAERNVSHIPTDPEFDRVIAARPGAIAISRGIWITGQNKRNRRILANYINRNCRLVDEQKIIMNGAHMMIRIFGDCYPDR